MATTGWTQLRQQARNLETQTENLFHTYSQFSSAATLAAQPSDDETRTEAQIDEILEQRESVLAHLGRTLDSDTALAGSAVKRNTLARHREVLAEHGRERRRLGQTLAAARDRQGLLGRVRADIAAHRARGDPAAAEADYMLDERARLDRSHNTMDGVLGQAYAVSENMGAQREMLGNINRRIVGAASAMPGINNLMTRIGAKRRRDGVIMGGFIAFCFLVVFFFS